MDLRRSPRVPVHVPVEFSVVGESAAAGEGAIAGHARDISLGGMFLETERAPAFGAEVVVKLALTGGAGAAQILSLPGVVRWTGAGGVGVQFKLLGVRETYAITEIVRNAER